MSGVAEEDSMIGECGLNAILRQAGHYAYDEESLKRDLESM